MINMSKADTDANAAMAKAMAAAAYEKQVNEERIARGLPPILDGSIKRSSTNGGRRRRLKKTAGRRRSSRRNSLSAMLSKPLKMLMGKKTRKYRRGSRRH